MLPYLGDMWNHKFCNMHGSKPFGYRLETWLEIHQILCHHSSTFWRRWQCIITYNIAFNTAVPHEFVLGLLLYFFISRQPRHGKIVGVRPTASNFYFSDVAQVHLAVDKRELAAGLVLGHTLSVTASCVALPIFRRDSATSLWLRS